MGLDIQEFENTNEELQEEVYQKFIQEVNGVIEQFEQEKVIYIKDMSLALSLSFKGKQVDTVSFPDLDSQLKIVNEHHSPNTKGTTLLTMASFPKYLT